jgi:hypothetical protein
MSGGFAGKNKVSVSQKKKAASQLPEKKGPVKPALALRRATGQYRLKILP